MRGVKNGYDIVIANKIVKELIIKRAKEYNISIGYVCKKVGVDWFKFKRYLTLLNPTDWRNVNINQEDIIRVAEAIGIKIKLELILHNNIDIEQFRISKEEFKKEQKLLRAKASCFTLKYDEEEEEILEQLSEQEGENEITKPLKDEII